MATARCKSPWAPRRRPIGSPKPEAGHFAKAQVEPGQGLWEFRLADGEGADLKPGAEIKVDLFKKGQLVDVAGVTKGKGYAGVIKRHQFLAPVLSHGNSLSHRAPGAIGQRQTPGRVFPGKRMAGHLGNERASDDEPRGAARRRRAQRAARQGRGTGRRERPRDREHRREGSARCAEDQAKAAGKEGKDGGKKDAGKKDAAKDKK